MWKRHRSALSLDEREDISRGLEAKRSIKDIGAKWSRAPSTISREIRRHGGVEQYCAAKADTAAWENALRPKPYKLIESPKCVKSLQRRCLRTNHRSKSAVGQNAVIQITRKCMCHMKRFIKSFLIQTRGALKKELQLCPWSGRSVRRTRTWSLEGKVLGSIPDARPISERPLEAADRSIPSHWEADLIQDSKSSYIVTLVERHSHFVILTKIRDDKTIMVISALIKQARELPVERYKTLTWDRGAKMTSHTRFTVATDIQIYFCNHQPPWQRGSNKNRLLRQYFPKGTDLSVHSQQGLNSIAGQLNERPRKTLDYESPAERFNKCVASICWTHTIFRLNQYKSYNKFIR